jgi:hypothetical protein
MLTMPKAAVYLSQAVSHMDFIPKIVFSQLT